MVHRQLCEVRHRLSGKLSVSNHMALIFTLGFALVRTLSTLYRLIMTDGSLLNFPYHFKFVFNVLMELQLFCLLAELDQSFDSINSRLAQLRRRLPNNSLTLSGGVFADRWRLPQCGESIGVQRYSVEVKLLCTFLFQTFHAKFKRFPTSDISVFFTFKIKIRPLTILRPIFCTISSQTLRYGSGTTAYEFYI